MIEKDFEKLVFGMAHQIRNPCAIILANANLVLKNRTLSAENRQSLEAIVNGVRYLEARLDEFVEFSKPLIIKSKKVSLNQICQEIVTMVKERCELQKTRISCNLDRELILSGADHQQILLALINIVLNAIESQDQGGTVTLDAHRSHDETVLTVRDNGSGIHPRDLPEVFSPFYSTKEGGIGIGLAVSKKIIEAHRGKIEVSSLQGKGTTVTVRIPSSDLSNRV